MLVKTIKFHLTYLAEFRSVDVILTGVGYSKTVKPVGLFVYISLRLTDKSVHVIYRQ